MSDTTLTEPSSAAAPERERRPAILAVDDDPAVLAAVARDLRRGFGRDLRTGPGTGSGDLTAPRRYGPATRA